MSIVATPLMTADEFFEFCHRPENRDRHYELERGRIVEMARPGQRHCVVCGNTTWILGSYSRQIRKGYVCSNDMGVIWEHDPDTVRGPDVLYYAELRRSVDLQFCL